MLIRKYWQKQSGICCERQRTTAKSTKPGKYQKVPRPYPGGWHFLHLILYEKDGVSYYMVEYDVFGSTRAGISQTSSPAINASCAAAPAAAAWQTVKTWANFDAPTAAADCSYTITGTTAYTASQPCAAAPAAAAWQTVTTWANFDAPTDAAHCSYTITGTTTFTPAQAAVAEHYHVSIDKDTYPDFFKVGDNGYARAYQSNK